MGPTAKLDRLKYTWIGYAGVVHALGLFQDGFTSDMVISAAIAFAVSAAFAVYLTRQLVQKSSLVWAFGVVFGLIGAITAIVTIVQTIFVAVDGNDLDLYTLGRAIASGYVHVQTFRILRDREVKRHVMLD